MKITVASVAMMGLLLGCKGEGSAPAASSSAAPTAAATATGATTAAAATGDPPTTNLTPAKLQENAGKLMSKRVQGEGIMYAFESGMLNGKMSYSAYIADDEKKTNSFKCSTDGNPKMPKNAKVSFEGIWRGGGWLDECKVTLKK